MDRWGDTGFSMRAQVEKKIKKKKKKKNIKKKKDLGYVPKQFITKTSNLSQDW